MKHFENFDFWARLWPVNDILSAINFTFILLVKFQLNWSILKILTFEPLYDPLMTLCNMAYGLSCFKNHTHTLSQGSAQLDHFEKKNDFWTPLWPLNDTLLHSTCLATCLKVWHAVSLHVFYRLHVATCFEIWQESSLRKYCLNTNILRLCPIFVGFVV